MNEEAKTLIDQLGLAPLPEEGGFFRRTWTSRAAVSDGRAAGSTILFLLTGEDFSAFHRLVTDELWFFHAGDPVEHVQLTSTREGPLTVRLGADVLHGETVQLLVPGKNWQGARLALPRASHPDKPPVKKGWALVSCTMVPAWDEREFSLGKRPELLREHPSAAPWIHALTR